MFVFEDASGDELSSVSGSCSAVAVCVNVVEFSVWSHQYAANVLCGAVPKVSNTPTVTECTYFCSCPIQPMEGMGTVAVDSRADFYLLDRVINVMPNGAVPYKMKGTVIGIHGRYFK